MSSKSQKFRLGIFIFVALFLLVASISLLVGIKILNPRDRYFVNFRESVSGLEIGSTVRMNGVRVGQIEEIAIGRDVQTILVKMALTPGTPITTSTQAAITSQGITGLKFVELTGGSAHEQRIKPNTSQSEIKAGASAFESLTGKATDIAVKMEGVLNNLLRLTGEDNQNRVHRLLDDADNFLVTSESLVNDNKKKVSQILSNLDQSMQGIEKAALAMSALVTQNEASMRETITAAASSAKALQRMTQNLNPQPALNAFTEAANSMRKRIEDPELRQAITSLNSAAVRTEKMVEELSKILKQRDRQTGIIIDNMQRASAHLKDFSRAIKDRPSLLFRGETEKERDIP